MTERSQLVIDYAVEFLRLDAEHTDAKVNARAKPHDDELYSLAHMVGEERETARRALADMIIKADPSKKDAVREAVIHPLSEGVMCDFHTRLKMQPAVAKGGVYGRGSAGDEKP